MCADRKCLVPTLCPRLNTGHDEYLELLRRIRTLPTVKKVFVRSGLRYDYIMADKDDTFFKELVQHHVSGQLKVAPEHASPRVLKAMGKPPIEVFDKFADRFYTLTKQVGKEQYLVPYLISSHPGSTLQDAAELALWLHKNRLRPEQVQDFYPTPGTVSTAMFYTGLDPATRKPIYVPKDPEEKAMQRALLQYFEPRNRALVEKALRKAGREELLPVLLGDGRRRVSGIVANPKAPGKDKGAAPIAKAQTFFSSNKKNTRAYQGVGGSSLASSHSTSSSSHSPGFERGKTDRPAGAAPKNRGKQPGKGRGAGR